MNCLRICGKNVKRKMYSLSTEMKILFIELRAHINVKSEGCAQLDKKKKLLLYTSKFVFYFKFKNRYLFYFSTYIQKGPHKISSVERKKNGA